MLTTYARRVFHSLLAWVALLMLSVPLAAAAVSVSVSPTTASVLAGAQQQFTATVTGTTDTAVTWTATGGIVSSTGLFTAPATAGTYTVKATSAANTKKSASATVTVPTITVNVSPSSVTLGPGVSQTFVATVSGTTNTAVIWASTGGSISSAGVYTAPATVGTYTVKATAQADGVASGTATVTVSPTITIFPAAATIPMSAPGIYSTYAVPSQLILTATVAGMTDQRMIWTASSGGKITNSSNANTARFQAPEKAGTFIVTAKSYVDRKILATAAITVGAVAPYIGRYSITTADGATGNNDGVPLPVTSLQVITYDWEIAGAETIRYSQAQETYYNWGDPSPYVKDTTYVREVSATSVVPYSVTASGPFGSSSATVYLEVHPRGTITSLVPDHWTGQVGDTLWVTPVFSGTGKATWSGTTVDVQSGVAFPVVMNQDALSVTLQAFSDLGVAGDSKSITLYLADHGRFTYIGKAGFPDARGLVALPEALGQVWFGSQGKAIGFRPLDVASGTFGGTFTPFDGNAQVNLATVNDVEGPFWLGDGRILMFGMDRSTIGVYDPATRRALFAVQAPWSAAVPTGIRGAIAPLGSGRFWVLGSDGSASIFDIRTSAFSSSLATGAARLDPDLTVLADGRVLVSGGQIAGAPTLSAMIFDPSTNTVMATGSMQNARFRPKGILLANGKVLVSGGIAGGGTALELFDPSTGTFTATGSALSPRQAHNLTQLSDGRVLISSGVSPVDGKGVVGSEFYTPSTGQVTRGPYLEKDTVSNNAGPYTLAVPLADGKVLFTGGTSTQSTDDVFLFDPQSLLQVQPALGRIFPDQQLAFTANAPVTWTVWEGAVGGSVDGTGNYTPPTTPGTYHVVATSTADSTRFSTATMTVLPKSQAVISSFTASATTVPAGTSVTLTPVFSGGTGSLQGVGIATSGSPVAVTPTATTTYFLDVVDANGLMATASLTVHVTPVLLSFTSSAAVIAPGESATLSWSSLGATDGSLSNGSSVIATGASGSIVVTPAATTTYTLTLTSLEGGLTRSVTVIVSVVRSISITPSSITLYTGQIMTFGSAITSAASTAVTWSASSGTLVPNGGQADYTAPATPGTTTVTVTSVADPARSSTATVTVIPPDVTLTATPAQLYLITGTSGSLGSSIQVTGSNNTDVTWGTPIGNLLGKGASAFYTAPLVAGQYDLTVASVANPAVSVIVPVVVSAPSTTSNSLSVIPSQATLAPGQRVFIGTSYMVPDPSSGLAWISSGGVLQPDAATASAFLTAPTTPGTYTVTITDKAGLTLSATASFTVGAPNAAPFAVTPSAATLFTGQSMLLEAADAQGLTLPRVLWAVQEANGGVITSAGQYVAPTTAGTYHVVATNPDNAAQTAIATITVVAGGGGDGGGGGGSTPTNNGVSVAPDTASIPAGTYQSLSAVVTGPEDQTITWSVENQPAAAGVDSSGVFMANQPGTYRVFATSAVDPALTGSAVMTVVSSVTPIPGAPVNQTLRGYSVTALADGRVLIAGGFDGVNYVGASKVFDPATQVFTDVTPMLQARAWHEATLLQDGRVLMSGGISDTGPNRNLLGRIRDAEVFNPATNQFENLPGGAPMRGWHVGVTGGSAAVLGNGQVLIVGGEYGVTAMFTTWLYTWLDQERFSDLFDPATNTFDVSNLDAASGRWILGLNAFNTRSGAKTITLDDGRALITGGSVPPVRDNLDPCTGLSPGDFVYHACVLNEAAVYSAVGGLTQLPPMRVPRAWHTMAKLADGRVLITGGIAAVNFIANPPAPDHDPQYHWASTNTAEIYDPATGTFTAVGNLNEARGEHAAILLPTGQVMIVGGTYRDGAGNTSYPKTVELYDPDSGTFSVMDRLGYGIEEPKLAMQKDGNVFVTGTVQGVPATSVALRPGNGGESFSIVGNTLPILGSLLTALVMVAPTFRVDAMTLNQGVERFINQPRQESSVPAGLPWNFRKDVPILSNRSTRVRVFVNVNISGSSSTSQSYAIESKLYVAYKSGARKEYTPLATGSYPTGTGSTFNGSVLPLRNTAGAIVHEVRYLERAAKSAELQFEIPAADMTIDVAEIGVVLGPKILACSVLPGGALRMERTTTEMTLPPVTESLAVTRSQSVTVHVVPFPYTYKDDAGNLQVKQLDLNVVKAALQSRMMAYLPLSQDALTVDVVGGNFNIQWDETTKSKTLNATGSPSAFEELTNIVKGPLGLPGKTRNEFYFVPIPYIPGHTDSMVITGAPGHLGGVYPGTHNALVDMNADGSDAAASKPISIHELLHAHDIQHINDHVNAAPPFEAFPEVQPYVGTAGGGATQVYGLIGVSAWDYVGNFDLMTNNLVPGRVQWISDYTFAKASDYYASTQGVATLSVATPALDMVAAPPQPQIVSMEESMKMPTLVPGFVSATLMAMPQGPVDAIIYVRSGLVGLGGLYSPTMGVRIPNPDQGSLYFRSNDDENQRAHIKRYSEILRNPADMEKGYTAEVVPEGKPSFRVRVDATNTWTPGEVSWDLLVDERLRIKEIRLYKDNLPLGQVFPKDSKFEPEVDFRYEAGRLRWRAPDRTQVGEIFGSNDGGKTWRRFAVHLRSDTTSIPVDLTGSPRWVFALEYRYLEDGKYYRKEIEVNR